MTGFGRREHFLKNATESLLNLHKGLGVRHRNLRERLGPELRELWTITATDMASVMSQTIVRLEEAISGIIDLPTAQIARVSYNIPPDPATKDLNHQERLAELPSRLGDGFSLRTVQRRDRIARDHIAVRLDQDWAPIPPGAVQAVLERERNPWVQPGQSHGDERLRREIRELLNPRAPVDRAIQGFLTCGVHVPRCSTGAFAIARTASHGAWVCAFTSGALLVEYQRMANPPWEGRPAAMLGVDLLREMYRLELRAGVLINPSADRNADLTETMSLPPALVNEIIERL